MDKSIHMRFPYSGKLPQYAQLGNPLCTNWASRDLMNLGVDGCRLTSLYTLQAVASECLKGKSIQIAVFRSPKMYICMSTYTYTYSYSFVYAFVYVFICVLIDIFFVCLHVCCLVDSCTPFMFC